MNENENCSVFWCILFSYSLAHEVHSWKQPPTNTLVIKNYESIRFRKLFCHFLKIHLWPVFNKTFSSVGMNGPQTCHGSLKVLRHWLLHFGISKGFVDNKKHIKYSFIITKYFRLWRGDSLIVSCDSLSIIFIEFYTQKILGLSFMRPS